jgi:hypothetical protein
MNIRLLFEPRDVWVGVFWTRLRFYDPPRRRWDVYVCLVPMLPIRFRWWR